MHFRESRKEIENKMETKSRKMKFTDYVWYQIMQKGKLQAEYKYLIWMAKE